LFYLRSSETAPSSGRLPLKETNAHADYQGIAFVSKEQAEATNVAFFLKQLVKTTEVNSSET
jgi:hypothetical protein